MINGLRVIVVMPAYNAEKTLRQTLMDIDRHVVDDVIVVDDGSQDGTVSLARGLGLRVHVHGRNLGYGGNQKTCYRLAIDHGADIIVMLHPDYQYTPRLLPAMAAMIAYGEYDVVLASRILGRGALQGGMPFYKYVANRLLTAVENVLLGLKLSEYHTGYRAFSRDVLLSLPLDRNSNDFVFDNQIIAQAAAAGFRIGEISCPTRYQPDSSSINFPRSVRYGLGVLATGLQYRLFCWNLSRPRFLAEISQSKKGCRHGPAAYG
jgi:glycosyltransferase involved in cell wall biosynthesis